MPAQWTGALIGKMHIYGITIKKLSDYMSRNPKYVSSILNGHCQPLHAEERFTQALNELIAQREEQKGQ